MAINLLHFPCIMSPYLKLYILLQKKGQERRKERHLVGTSVRVPLRNTWHTRSGQIESSLIQGIDYKNMGRV